MFNFLYWSLVAICSIWALGGTAVLFDNKSQSFLANLVITVIFTYTPLVVVIMKKSWLKSLWNRMFCSIKNNAEVISEKKHEKQTKKVEVQEQRNSEKAFYCMQVLTFVAISDNNLASADKEIIANFMRNIFSVTQTTEAIRMLDEWGSTTKLSQLNIKEPLSKINQLCSRDERRKIVDACQSLIRVDGRIDNTESSIFGLIRSSIYPTELGSLFSTKCENCKSDNCKKVSAKEVDRWLARKEVTERLASGKVRTKNVSITKVKIEYHWLCGACNHQWLTTETSEKN
jgi:hypothetical protein